MAIGTHEETGKKIDGLPELQQRIQRLFRTRKNNLVIRRAYGSNLPKLVDKKTVPGFRLDVCAEAAETLANPANEIHDEFKLHRTQLDINNETGAIDMVLVGEYLVDGEIVRLEGITL
ncbi:hypothetical protein NX722_13635 [Endozoicomonas gorgoniicola]|uniref:Phage baseplate protein n=1 Tax=Endozoicomonas gorgoniicola TaxID=1234144 RepID=A0ABT3MWA6_9GAMM|nr:hypothetical protein [Endozoicomonas gorgoniicola]MCW7553650.1 hypothetical protein [Endozoicomonas gorgoniicola]